MRLVNAAQIVSIVLFSLLAAGCSRSSAVAVGSPNAVADASAKLQEIYGDGIAIETVANADAKLEAVLLQGPASGSGEVSDFKPSGSAVPVPDDVGRELQKILLSDASYWTGMAVSCIPNYGLRITVTSGSNEVEFYFCFECTIVAIQLNGKPVGGALFEPAKGELLQVALKLFPTDKRLQRLAAGE